MPTLLFLALACTSAPPEPPPTPQELYDLAPGDVVIVDANAMVVVREGRIQSVGPAPEGVVDLPDGGTIRTVDRVTAGFVDAHAHPIGVGKNLAQLDLSGAATYEETLSRIQAAKVPAGGWILGRGWDQNDWSDAPEGGWPLARDLDALHPDTPVAVRRIDGHALWANAAAMRAAGVTAATEAPDGGRILRDDQGQPTGVFVDNAMDLVKRPEPTDAELLAWARAGLAECARTGLTGVHAMGASDRSVATYEKLAAAGELPIRLWVYVDPGSQAAKKLHTSGPWTQGRLKVVGIKAYADGALGSRGALLHAEYSDEPGHTGLQITPPDELQRITAAGLATGAQTAVHAIGDKGVSNVLDAFELAKRDHPNSELRLRVEHAQVVREADFSRFSAMGVVASMQPTHATSDMPWAQDRVGSERIGGAYAWRRMLDEGAVLAFGSDAPVESIDPSHGLWSATTRAGADGEPARGWTPGQKLSTAEAISAFTLGAAKAVHEDEHLGRLAAGYEADLTLWTVEQTPHGERWKAAGILVDGQLAN